MKAKLLLVLLIGIFLLGACCAPEMSVKPSIATTPAEIGELVEIGMTRPAVNELIDKTYFEFVSIQLSVELRAYSQTANQPKLPYAYKLSKWIWDYARSGSVSGVWQSVVYCAFEIIFRHLFSQNIGWFDAQGLLI